MVRMVTRMCVVVSCVLVASLGGCSGGSPATSPPDAPTVMGGSDVSAGTGGGPGGVGGGGGGTGGQPARATNATPPLCIPGASVACACVTGQTGAQTCTSAGTFAACVCVDTPSADGGAAVSTVDAPGTPTPDAQPPVDTGPDASSPLSSGFQPGTCGSLDVFPGSPNGYCASGAYWPGTTIRCSICVDSKTLQSVNPAQPCLTYDGTSGFPYSSIGGNGGNVICLPQSSGGGSLPCDIYCPTRAADAGLLQRDTATATPDTAADAAPFTPDAETALGPRYVSVAAGLDLTCGVKTDGTVACWGNIASISCGGVSPPVMGTVSSVGVGDSFLCAVRPGGSFLCCGDILYGSVDVGPGTLSTISARGDYACGVRTDGPLACWGGSNRYGQTSPPTGSFVSVSAGDYHACGVKTDGTVACWGDNNYGESTPPTGTFSSVGAGGYHTCGVKTDGTVACWGLNNTGQSTPPTGTFSSVSAGGNLTCGVKTDGTVACWGDFGPFWTSGSNNYDYVPPAGAFVSLSVGDYYACGVKTDGTVACWGDNSAGESTPP